MEKITHSTQRVYSEEITQIHNEFYNNADEALREAKFLLKDAENASLSKGRKMLELGFVQAKEASEALLLKQRMGLTEESAEYVRKYNKEYPLYKFITLGQVREICRKYGLVCGEISLYKGFVPADKVDEICAFKIDVNDISMEEWSRGLKEYANEIINDDGESYRKWPSLYKIEERKAGLKICAPAKDMDMRGKRAQNFMVKDIPDPIVLQPVHGGYLIVCAWGDEASDEIVVNEKFN